MFLTDFRTQKYTGGIISWVGIFLTVTPGARHPLWDPILLFLHTFSPKSAHVGGPRPLLTGPRPPPTGNPGSATA